MASNHEMRLKYQYMTDNQGRISITLVKGIVLQRRDRRNKHVHTNAKLQSELYKWESDIKIQYSVYTVLRNF